MIADEQIDALNNNTWICADPRALLSAWRLILVQPFELEYQANYLQVRVQGDQNQLRSLSQSLQQWQQDWQWHNGCLSVQWPLSEPQSGLLILQPNTAASSQRLNLLQQVQQRTLVATDIENQLEDILTHLGADELVGTISDEQPNGHSLELAAGEQTLYLELVREPTTEDREFFDCIGQLLQLSRLYIAKLAKQPQLLAELYELSSRIDKIKYVKADKGYSGIYEQNKRNPRFIVMRLKVIKLLPGGIKLTSLKS